jgi:pyrimidine deaminase RibD-like protein
MATSTGELFLRQALELAARGRGLASPNPLVGALIVDERGRVVGSGTHRYAELKHAEVLAIEQAGPLARGNTLYLNLESPASSAAWKIPTRWLPVKGLKSCAPPESKSRPESWRPRPGA